MKIKVEAPVDHRVWCEECRIRIAPSEERTVNRGKVYHLRCYVKPISASSRPKASDLRRGL